MNLTELFEDIFGITEEEPTPSHYDSLPYDVENIIFNESQSKKNPSKTIKTTIVYLKDGRKGVATCSEEDHFDPAVGFAMAYTTASCIPDIKVTNGKMVQVSNKSRFKKAVMALFEGR